MEWFRFDAKLNFFKVFLGIAALIFLSTWLLKLLTNSLGTSIQEKELIASTQSIETEDTKIFIPCLSPDASSTINTGSTTPPLSFNYFDQNILHPTLLIPNIIFAKITGEIWECRYRDTANNQWLIINIYLPYTDCQAIHPKNDISYDTPWFLCSWENED